MMLFKKDSNKYWSISLKKKEVGQVLPLSPFAFNHSIPVLLGVSPAAFLPVLTGFP